MERKAINLTVLIEQRLFIIKKIGLWTILIYTKNLGETMRIIHVEDYFDPTAGYQINELLIASKETNDQVFLITSDDMSPFHKQVDYKKDKEFEEKTGVRIIRLGVRFKVSSRLVLKNLRTQIEGIKPNIVFMHGIGDFKDLYLWGKKPNYIIVRDCHMSWVASKNKLRHLFYMIYRTLFASIINNTNIYNVIFALGDEEYEYLKKIGISNKKIDFLPHGYNETIMFYDEKERENIRLNYGFKEQDIIISYIGKFNYSKRPDLILDIIDMLEMDFIKANRLKLLFIGPKDDLYMKKFNKKVENLKGKIPLIIDEVKPFVELRKYYSASDICIFPKETTLSSIHAQVCGCPTIMEDHKSNIERVVKRKNLFRENNLVEAAQILKKIISEKEYLKENNIFIDLKEREYKKQMQKLKSIIET
ncbi:glycosyltransferase [Neobacillus notoginsengisoli]|uniref:Glycosyltransferase n=1 Tax=Neobacillus notoginsengisoli TaxID=1578198 RepID=A0A417YGY5_9BACI|nr:glycosyltransferase family 4 protein [Neobacillus notoginsengisoli]RHW32109.1 glycosyltransferase [Neobacillus notoginsengisoli]